MTFNECRDLVMLAVEGGLLSDESAVQRAEVEAYIPVAVQDVVAADARERALLLVRMKGAGSSVPAPSSHFEDFTLTLEKDGHYWVASIPGTVMQGDSGSLVGPATGGGVEYLPVAGPGAIGQMKLLGLSVKAFWLRPENGTTKFLFSSSPKDCTVSVSAALLPSCENGDKELPISGSMGRKVIDLCVQHFGRQRSAPADAQITGNDLNAQ